MMRLRKPIPISKGVTSLLPAVRTFVENNARPIHRLKRSRANAVTENGFVGCANNIISCKVFGFSNSSLPVIEKTSDVWRKVSKIHQLIHKLMLDLTNL